MKIKEVKSAIYVAEDGKEFSVMEECMKYEGKKRKERCVEYVRSHAIAMWSDEWSGLAGYFGCGGGALFLIEVDETICGFGNEFLADPGYDDINDYLGKKVFIRCDDERIDSDWYIEGTLEYAIKDMEYTLSLMNKWKEEK